MRSLFNFLKEVRSRQFAYSVHQGARKEALKQLKSIEVQKGPTDPRLLQLSDEYARDVLGSVQYAPWLYVYSAVAGTFREGWLPDNYYGMVVVPRISGEYGDVCDLRSLSHLIFNSELFPEICFQVNGVFFTRKKEVISYENLKRKLFEKSRSVVFKTDNSLQGTGIHVLDADSFDVEEIASIGNGVFQEYIRQHDVFNQMTTNSVVTLRITTGIDDAGDCSVRACYLRIGRDTDTFVTSTNVKVPVNLQTGVLNDIGFMPNWHEIDHHPDSGTRFAGTQLPKFEECLSTVVALHKKLPFIRCMGWDVCVDTSCEVKIMEWNGGHNDVKFTEATQGPCFAHFNWQKFA